MIKTETVDFVIIGTGIAGLTAAIQLAQRSKKVSIRLLTKSKLADTNTQKAQGGIAVSVNPLDSPQLHFQDTLTAGRGLCSSQAVKILTTEAPNIIKTLTKWGIKFDKVNHKFDLRKEGAHSRNRILHIKGDAAGSEIEKALITKVKKHPKILIQEYHLVLDLITQNQRCCGVWVYDIKNKKLKIYKAKAVLLATGGAGQLFLYNSNSKIATGNGISVAFRSGACLSDLEFIQFHPTALYLPDSPKGEPSFLISETLRGEGAVLVNSRNTAFMLKYHPQADLAPRDVVARAIFQEMKTTKTPYVFLDFSRVKNFSKRFPNIYNTCKELGVDLNLRQIKVIPAAHYIMGGVQTDLQGQTSIKWLWAAGECACTKAHGANRLASNSLLEGIIFGIKVADKSFAYVSGRKRSLKLPEKLSLPVLGEPDPEQINWNAVEGKLQEYSIELDSIKLKLKEIMTKNVGVFRNERGLGKAIQIIELLDKKTQSLQKKIFKPWKKTRKTSKLNRSNLKSNAVRSFFELKNMLLLAKLITKAARARKESRGSHFRKDFPAENDKIWKRHLMFQKFPLEKIFEKSSRNS